MLISPKIATKTILASYLLLKTLFKIISNFCSTFTIIVSLIIIHKFNIYISSHYDQSVNIGVFTVFQTMDCLKFLCHIPVNWEPCPPNTNAALLSTFIVFSALCF